MALAEPEIAILLGLPKKKRVTRKIQRIRKQRKNQNEWSGQNWGYTDEKWYRTCGGKYIRAVEKEKNSEEGEKWVPVPEVVEKPWDDNQEKIMLVNKMRLHIEGEGFGIHRAFLSETELKEVAKRLDKPLEERKIREVIATPTEEKLPDNWDRNRIEDYRKKIHDDFDGTALRGEIEPDPPVRGLFGYAYIPLRENAEPTRQKPFQMYGERQEAFKTIVLDWIDKKFIERPQKGGVEWLSQGFAVPKKSTKFPWRGVADMRGPNSQTRRCSYPLPCIEDILVKQGAKQIFSVLDLTKAFHQQPLHPDSRHITCTHTPFGIFQWRVNVMGLKNAGIQFQMMLDDRLEPVRDIADAYMDDIIVGTRVEEGEDLFAQHDKDLRRVLNLLQDEKLIADIDKCKFFVPEVVFCGHILRNGTRSPAPGKLSAIENWEIPRNITELRAFLGFTNYYSSYIKGYAEVVACLQDTLRVPREEGKKGSKKKITWEDQDQKAFQEIKNRLCSNLFLQRVNPDKPFVLRVDASGYAVGVVLEQLIDESRMPTPEDVENKKTVPVAFMSRKLTQCQRNWVPREQETYAIILALQKWESWIGLQPVLVLTDHRSLGGRIPCDPPATPPATPLRPKTRPYSAG